jgi:hypothetical protein
MDRHAQHTNLRQVAVKDMLLFLLYPSRGIRNGRQLGPALLGQEWEQTDDYELAAEFRQFLWEELEQWRSKLGIKIPSKPLSAEARLRYDLSANNSTLELLSLVWAHYIERLETKQLAEINPGTPRNIQLKIEAGRKEIAGLLAQRAPLVSPLKQPDEEAQSEQQDVQTLNIRVFDREDARHQRNRRIILEKVRRFWINGVLKHSVYNAVLLELNLRYRPDAVTHPWNVLAQRLDQLTGPLPLHTKIIDIFDEFGGEILILGTPGSGKTTSLLELTNELLARAEQNIEHPMPIVFNLASWSEQPQPLDFWLVDELNKRYGVRPELGWTWITNSEVLPLLDGLDEVKYEHRSQCTEAINIFRQDYGLSGLVVCSRRDDYAILSTPLQLWGAVELQPLPLAQIDEYLTNLGESVHGIRTALHADDALQELVQTPLILNIVILTYQGMPAEDVSASGSLEEQHSRLFKAYVQRMLKRRSLPTHYTEEQTTAWLAWLGHAMEQHDQSIFYIEWMQPNWLPTPAQQQRYIKYIGLLRGLVVGVSCGVLVVLSVLLLIMLSGWSISVGIVEPATILISQLVGGVVFGLVFGAIGVRAARQTKAETIQVVETLSWSRSTTRSALAIGLPFGVTCGLILGWALGVGTGLLSGLAIGLALGLLIIAKGLTGSEVKVKTSPNQGIWASAYNAVGVGLSVGLTSGAPIGLLAGLLGGGSYRLAFGLPFGLAVGLFMALFFGGEACLKHLLLRMMLYREGLVPRDYIHFLDYAAERILLQKVGGGYTFVHQLLKGYFAAQYDRPSQDKS